MEASKPDKRYVSIKQYASMCGVSATAIYQRLYRTEDGNYKEGNPSYLTKTTLSEVDGEFIDTKEFPPETVKYRGKNHEKV